MSTTTAKKTADHSAWVAKRIHSFVGIVPLGVFLVLHFSRNLSTLLGPEAFDSAVAATWQKPINYVWTVLLVYIPLFYHAIYGTKLALTGEKKSIGKYVNRENVRFALQRLSAIGLLGFLCAHLFLTRTHLLMGWVEGGKITYGYFAEHMWNNPVTAVTYLFGILAVAYHLGNGAATFCISWGISTGKRGIELAEYLGLGFGLFLLILGYASVAGFFMYDYTPTKIIGGPLVGGGALMNLFEHFHAFTPAGILKLFGR
jgi:succinate dehydrogenase / fumarate reductase cytochrome b subunit